MAAGERPETWAQWKVRYSRWLLPFTSIEWALEWLVYRTHPAGAALRGRGDLGGSRLRLV